LGLFGLLPNHILSVFIQVITLLGVCLQVINRTEIFQPQNVSNTLWAFASTGFHPTDAFLEMVENHLAENITQEAEHYSAQVRYCPTSVQLRVIGWIPFHKYAHLWSSCQKPWLYFPSSVVTLLDLCLLI
jgi:hypothetical protein